MPSASWLRSKLPDHLVYDLTPLIHHCFDGIIFRGPRVRRMPSTSGSDRMRSAIAREASHFLAIVRITIQTPQRSHRKGCSGD